MGGHAATGCGDFGQSTLLDLPTGQPTAAEFHIEREWGVGGGLGGTWVVEGMVAGEKLGNGVRLVVNS